VIDLSRSGADVVETHISRVFLREDDVFKVKKPVDLGFLDFTTIEKRKAACEAEVRLNRRLAERVYLGVVAVLLDGREEWAVHMRRLPDSDRADVRLADGRLGEEHLLLVAEKLAPFHERAPRRDEGIEVVRFNVRENFEQTRESIESYLTAAQVEEVESWQLRFLEENEALFGARVRDGRVREGHGDLRLEHVYIDDASEVTVIDCIEFNERFRCADVAADVVFLAMDLAWHGRVDFAERFLAFYARESNDFDLYPLVDFYESYRAFVRGKIASFVSQDEEARRYFLLALASGRRSLVPPAVVAVSGLIASGKSTVAERIAALMSAPVVDADRTRKHLAGLAPETPAPEKPFEGIYAPDFSERVYRELLRRAGVVLDSRRPVVLDASFRTRALRRDARELARERGVPFYLVECRAPLDLLRQRLEERDARTAVSDGRLEILDDFARSWEEVDELTPPEHVVLDTTLPLSENEARLREMIPGWLVR
jgi:hypothetical protein